VPIEKRVLIIYFKVKTEDFLYKPLYLGAAVNIQHVTIVTCDIIGSCVIKILRNFVSVELRYQSLTYSTSNMQIQDGIFPAILISGGPM